MSRNWNRIYFITFPNFSIFSEKSYDLIGLLGSGQKVCRLPMQRPGKNSKFNAFHRITALVEKRRIPENSRCIFGAISHKTSFNGGNFGKKLLLVKKK
jgi:hypothetical protein